MLKNEKETALEVESVHVTTPPEEEMLQLAESVNSGSVGCEDSTVEFSIRVTTLTMGLKTIVCKVKAITTVGEVKELLQTLDETNPPPERQRLIYKKCELKDNDVTLGELTPPVQEGSIFSMALELKMDAIVEEWSLQVSHYHDGIRDVVIDPSLLVLDLLEQLQSTEPEEEDDKWEGGRLRLGEHIVDDEDVMIKEIPEIINGSLLFYEATPIEGLTGCIDDLGDINARIPLETEASDMNLRMNEILNPIIHQHVEQLGNSSPISHEIQLWFEVRYYRSTLPNFQSVIVKAKSNDTIEALKLLVEAAFMQEQGWSAPADRQKLLCHAQVRNDSDLLSSYNLGSRGRNEEEPAIIQLYLRDVNQAAGSTGSPEDRDTAGSSDDGSPRRETLSSSALSGRTGGCSKIKKAQQVLFIIFILALGMIMLASGAVMLLNPTPNNGYCYSTFNSIIDSTCTFKSDERVWRPSMEKIAFLPSAVAKPCLDCLYTLPSDVVPSLSDFAATFDDAKELCNLIIKEIPTGVKQFTSLSLPMITQVISPQLCNTGKQGLWGEHSLIWIDAQLSDTSSQSYSNSLGEKLYISADMWEDNNMFAGDITKAYLQLDLDKCQIKVVEKLSRASVLCQYHPYEKRLVPGKTCKESGSFYVASNLLVPCADYCRNWCYFEQKKDISNKKYETQCCSSSEVSQGTCTCNSSYGNLQLYDHPNQSYSAKLQPASVIQPDTEASHYVINGVVFYYYKNSVLLSPGDIEAAATRIGYYTFEDCALKCVDTPSCRTFAYHSKTKYCQIWTHYMEQLPTLMPSSESGQDVYSSSMAKFSPACAVATPDSYADRDSCILSTWSMLQSSLVCHVEGDTNCDPGHVTETPSVFAVAFITGGGLLLYCFVACCAWDLLDHLRKQEGRLS